ncbi:MAG TPA: LysM peptidoglycan-binding domain-containing protein [Woeseiaceae bacterium]|nr:LysM peptidoglycan-binding domain-containing protein [Woeseiaceae bacterium]
MVPRTQSLNPFIRLTAVALAATLAGCSLNPFANDDEPAPAPASQPAPSYDSAAQAPVPEYSGPVVERVSQPVPLADNHPNEYVVKVGDTLWDIAATFLKDPWFWPEIWHINTQIENPHLIYPGDVLALVYIDGQPRITNVRASTYRLSPQARISPITQAVTSVPFESISAFLSSGAVLERRETDQLPYLLDTRGDHLIASAGNLIYVRGLDDAQVGSRYNVVEVGEPLIDPDDNRLIGYQGKFIAEGTLRRTGDPATVALTDSIEEAVPGDRLIPEVVDIPLNFYPRTPSNAIDGRIISVVGGVTQIGQYQVVVLNRGTRDGLAVGDVLTVYQTGETIDDRFGGGRVRLPDEEAGTLMVFKVYDRIGYGLVMEATQAIHIHDTVRNPT